MIIAMAGLPGTGKSTLANALAEKLPAVVLNKDLIRAALFLPEEIDHSWQQDDFVVNVMLEVAEYYFLKDPERVVILDGRTFSKKAQVETLVNYSQEHNRELKVIYCSCPDEIARDRIERDIEKKEHLASDRDFELYIRLQSLSDPLQVPHFSVNTGEKLEYCVQLCLNYLNKPF
jgi:adenylylsulfate kinase